MKRIFIGMAGAVMAMALSACGMMSADPPPPPPVYGPVAAFIIAQEPGDSTVVSDPEFGEGIKVIIQDSFASASGELCKRATLLAEDKQAEVVVLCRKGEGPWTMAPRIWGQGL